MKKFFTLCLAFMLALLYNANAAETGWNTYVSVSPAEGQVSELSEIVLTFEHGVFKGWDIVITGVTLEKPDGSTVSCSAFGQGTKGNNVTVSVEPACTEPGVYKLNIPAGAMEAGMRGPTNGEMNLQWTISSSSEGATPEWAPVFEGVEDGGLYFNSVSYTINAPGADKVDIVMNKNGAEYWSTSATAESLPWSNGADEGEWEIIATATKGNETFSTTVNFTVEKTSSAYDLNEFIGSTGKKQYKYNAIYVLAQAGEYTYVKDDTRSVLIYGQAPKFNVGDCLQDFTAEYKDNNGQHQLIPYAFGSVMGNYPQQPEVITIDQVTVANQSKLVKIENAAIDGETIGGIAYFNRFNTVIPANGTYTVTAIIGMNNGAVQLEPIAFEGFVIEPFTYTELVPADKAEVTSLSEIKITFPYNVTYDAEVSVLVMDGANMITPQVSVEGAVATLTFDAITAYGSKPSLMVMAGAFKEATSGVGCQQIMAAWSIPTPPITYDLAPVKVTPASGSTVEKLERITLQVPEEVSDCRLAAQYYGNDFITVTDDKGNSYNGKLGYTSYTEYYYLYVENATASGTYTITVKEGVFGDEQYLKKFEKGHANPEFTLTYTIKAASLAAPTVDPANGAEVENPSTVTLTFAEAVTVNAEAGAITLVRNSDAAYDKQEAVVTISEDGLTATLTCKPVYPTYEPKWYVGETYTMSIPAGYFVNASGAANEALSYSWKLVAPKFNVTKTTPEVGEVEQLDVIKIYFSEKVYLNNSNPINILNEAGEVATTATVKGKGAWVSEEVYESWIEATLAQPVTTPGQYTLVVPEGLAKNVNWGEGAINAAANLTYTVTGVVVDPNTYTLEYNVSPTAGEVTELSKLEFTPITEGLIYMPTDEAQVANWVKVTDANGNVYNTTAKGGRGYEVNIEGVTEPGTYTVVVPKGSFYDFKASMSNPNSKNFNDEIVLTYTLKAAPAVEDFTPVVSPAAGEVTAEQIKTTVITFPAPVASFDGSDVGLRHQFGGPWYDYAATGTISEDKLSMTIVWDFTPSVGTTYTLKLPAGCIVLENGAKNVATEVPYTVVAAVEPLATPTVSPANDTEVENLNTITLTFAEAVTANAEAGAISIVNTSDPNYDYAKEIRVAISEDGLTATITCVPGYLDRWAPGKTYKLNIPAGYFVATSGATSEAIEYSWTIAAPKFTYVAVDPAQGDVTELSEILISFAQKTYGNGSDPTLNLVDANGNVVTTASTVRAQDANGNWFAIKAMLKDKVTTPGTYKLVVPADVLRDEYSTVTNAAFDLTWTVLEPDPTTYTLTLNTNPAQGEVTELSKISLSPAGGVFMILATAEAQTENWCKVTDANGNSYNSKIELSGQYYALNIEDATEEGEYTVVIPKKSFYDAMNQTNFNDEIVLKYEIVAPDNTVYDYTPVSVSPANGSEVESLEKIHITFPYGAYDCLWGALSYSTDFIKVSDENGKTYEAKLGYGSYNEDYYIYVKNATQPGTYTIVVPKALVFDAEYADTFESGHANPEFTLTYTIVAPQVDDFTPVINPTAGNVTKEQIKTTVLSFESPIASFDNSDVRYAKPAFGSVWCSVAGSYTIAEDKLSLTINWDFSPEVGLTYTLELPAGCIVLENGAKNLFTQVKYTVVGGPKDLAEFVVPEGINGYINYDETDVNAWAPEFPFTVSTSAINTIQFTAELPSLPAGITAMEVIDENGEVIATLNQDGVAPLADGEIYYVKGETTKEYADGAELKFRFRFTHLGVSETIQFSYIVAGGNITSIADVELNGNVIVRGNDIIAPQGAAIFTVSGIRVPAEGLAPGVYVVVLGKQAVKVMVK
ncbi:MAG: Ig-like domain-containing protein [Muribaculaceae bacterium]|nr:Ig-like domain-containing protein [Muribaculaceae bacterium]